MQIRKNHLSNLLLLLTLSIAVLQALLAFNYKINTDEFFFLSQVYEYSRNELGNSLQTFHVHFFSWLTHISGSEINQIDLGRLCMLVAEIISVTAIIFSARNFVSFEYAIFAGFAWLVSGYTISDGASFRTDPLATALLMVALALSLSPKINFLRVSLAGIFVSVATLVTVKSVLYAPAFFAVALWQKEQLGMQKVLRLVLLVILVTVISFCSLYLLHKTSLSIAGKASTSMAKKSLEIGFLNSQLFPDLASLLGWVILSIVPIFFMVLAVKDKLSNLLFLLPLFSVVVYRNSYPYFYPFISAPAFILVAIGISKYRANKWLNILFLLLILMGISFHLFNGISVTQEQQKNISKIIHQIFPKPVNYIDQVAILPTYPKKGFFMTTWGMQNYHNHGRAIMDQILKQDAPPLLIADHEVLLYALGAHEKEENRLYLFPEDNEALRSAYIKYWGPIYVAGIERKITASPVRINVRIAGKYRNASESPIEINGKTYQVGEVVNLKRGESTFSADKVLGMLLVWADAGPHPKLKEPENLLLF